LLALLVAGSFGGFLLFVVMLHTRLTNLFQKSLEFLSASRRRRF
jgi:hypothetical protein